MNKLRTQLIAQDCQRLQNWLQSGFESPKNGEQRFVSRGINDAYIIVNNFPLPDGYHPDHIDLMIVTTDYPTTPPIGFYVLVDNNEKLIRQLRTKFEHTYERGFYGAETITGYVWICYHYENHTWRFNIKQSNRGDNIQKFLDQFYIDLENAR